MSRRFLYAAILAELLALFLLVRVSPALARDLKRIERHAVRALRVPRA